MRSRPAGPGCGRTAWIAVLAGVVLGSGLLPASAPPARASLLGPLLQLLRPQLETRLGAACAQWASGGDEALARQLQRPCAALAAPASRCLIEESERSGRSLALIGELAAGRLGADGEQVVKRCASRLLGLPPDSLREVPLQSLAERFRGRAGRPAQANPEPIQLLPQAGSRP